MGYTHYWNRPAGTKISDKNWKRIKSGVRNIIKQAKEDGIVVQKEYDVAKPTVINNDLIRFNGIEDEGHETLYISRIAEQPEWRKGEDQTFDFCKTARKPYDAIVVSVLALIHSIEGKDFEISSDGNYDEQNVFAPPPYYVSGVDYEPEESEEVDLQVALNLTIDTAGVDIDTLKTHIHNAIRNTVIGEGLFTGELPCSITEWNAEVTYE